MKGGGIALSPRKVSNAFRRVFFVFLVFPNKHDRPVPPGVVPVFWSPVTNY